MKRTFLAFVFAGAASAALAIPTIVGDSVSVTAGEGDFASKVSYTLAGGPAIVTVDIETNTLADASGDWVQIDGEDIRTMVGEANKVVTTCDSPVTAWWWPGEGLAKAPLAAGQLRAVVRAWPTNDPPDYLVVELGLSDGRVPNGTNPRGVPWSVIGSKVAGRRFYTTAKSLPGGLLANNDYRTTKLVMRRIPAAGVIWWMGSPTDELPGVSGKYDTAYDQEELRHRVRLSKDYYIAVFEMTQRQYFCFNKWNPSKNQSAADWDVRPVENVAMADLRGRRWTSADDHAYCWPEDGHAVAPGTASAMGMLRDLTGIEFDLPTNAQWEYACRAGTGGAFANGATTLDDACKIGWFAGHMPESNGVAAPVGKKDPNAWGLYDMHGNVAELLLDNNALAGKDAYVSSFAPDWESGGITDDPVGPRTDIGPKSPASSVIRRGGSCSHGWQVARSAAMMCGTTEYNASYIGFRVSCPIEGVAE